MRVRHLVLSVGADPFWSTRPRFPKASYWYSVTYEVASNPAACPPAKFVAALVKDGLGKRVGLSSAVVSVDTEAVNGPGCNQTILIVDPETVALTGEEGLFSD